MKVFRVAFPTYCPPSHPPPTGRIGIAAQMLGLAQGAFSLSVPYTYTRTQFSKPVGTFQSMAFSFAAAHTNITSARLLTYNAARRKENGLDFVKDAAMAKWWASKVAQEVSGSAIEWMGGVGFTRETGVEKFWRDSKIVSMTFFFFFEMILTPFSGCDI